MGIEYNFINITGHINILVEDELLPVFQHGFLRSEENVDLHKFQYYGAKCW